MWQKIKCFFGFHEPITKIEYLYTGINFEPIFWEHKKCKHCDKNLDVKCGKGRK